MECYTVTEESLELITERLNDNVYRDYLKWEMVKCDLRGQHLVIFHKGGIWGELHISKAYNVDFVMKMKWGEL